MMMLEKNSDAIAGVIEELAAKAAGRRLRRKPLDTAVNERSDARRRQVLTER